MNAFLFGGLLGIATSMVLNMVGRLDHERLITENELLKKQFEVPPGGSDA